MDGILLSAGSRIANRLTVFSINSQGIHLAAVIVRIADIIPSNAPI